MKLPTSDQYLISQLFGFAGVLIITRRTGTMKQLSFSAVIAFGFLIAGPALASPCGDAIRVLEPRVDEAVSKSAALSSGGQAVAASRESQAMQADKQPAPPGSAVQKLPEHDVGATAAATPLAGGDNAMRARAALSRAQALDRDGNASGCDTAVEEVRRELGPAQ
jgi:predicted lipid-binding transport protein (Tim44 family)